MCRIALEHHVGIGTTKRDEAHITCISRILKRRLHSALPHMPPGPILVLAGEPLLLIWAQCKGASPVVDIFNCLAMAVATPRDATPPPVFCMTQLHAPKATDSTPSVQERTSSAKSTGRLPHHMPHNCHPDVHLERTTFRWIPRPHVLCPTFSRRSSRAAVGTHLEDLLP